MWCKMLLTGVAHLHVLWIRTLGDHRSAVLQSPSQQRLCRALVMLHCNCGDLLVLHDVTALMLLTIWPQVRAQEIVHK